MSLIIEFSYEHEKLDMLVIHFIKGLELVIKCKPKVNF